MNVYLETASDQEVFIEENTGILGQFARHVGAQLPA